MKYVKEIESLADFPAWNGGKDTLAVLIEKGDTEKVERLISELGETPATETWINDFLWFECDYIAEYLGHKDWEEYERGE